MIRRLLTAPLLHCLILGALCYAVLGWEQPSIRIDAASLSAMETEWLKVTGRSPDAQERRTLLDIAIRDELLLREARRRQLHHLPVVEQRLTQLAEFLQLTDSDDPRVLHRQAERLGLLDQDPVVRRYLINTLEMLLAEEASLDAVDAAAINAHYQNHLEDYRNPRRLDLRQLYFAGDDAQTRAEATLAALQAGELSTEQALARGDNFYGGHHWRGLTDPQLGTKLGQEFLTAVQALPTLDIEQWYGPLPSAYGLHLIRVEALSEASQKPLAEVQPLIRAKLVREHKAAHIEHRVAEWRRQYRIELPEDGSQ